MYSDIELLRKLRDKYCRLWKKLMKKARCKVAGRLKISQRKGKALYYHDYTDPETHCVKRVYLGTQQTALVRQLAQKSYDNKLRRLIASRLRHLESVCHNYCDEEIDLLYTALRSERQQLITPIEPTWAQRQKEWLETPYPTAPPSFPRPEIFSKKGEQLRSKTEKILADMFYEQNIPYKYECPLWLENQWYYPDFTFLSPYTKDEVYWEHMGMMGDEEYVSRTIHKLLAYSRNQIYSGKNLIFTFETRNMPLDFRWAQHLINYFLIKAE